MGTPTALTQPTRQFSRAPETSIEKYIRLHGADARSLMAAFEHEQGAEALEAIDNELWMPSPDPVFLMTCLEELLFIFETTSYSDLLDHVRWYAGPDLIGAWHYHGARIADLVKEGSRHSELVYPV